MSTAWLVRVGDYNVSDKIRSYTKPTASTIEGVTPLPFGDGAIDNYGEYDPPKPHGVIQASFMIAEYSSAAFSTSLDTFIKHMRRGRHVLQEAPANTSDSTAWRRTFARASAIQVPYSVGQMTHAEIPVTFIQTDPYWYNNPSASYLDGSKVWGDSGFDLNDGVLTSTVNDGTTLTYTNVGTAPTRPVFQLRPGAGTVANFQIDRVDPDNTTRILQTFKWVGTLPTTAYLIVDCFEWRALTTDSSLNPIDLSYGKPSLPQRNWMELAPGSNTLIVRGTFGADASLDCFFESAYH